MKLNRERLLASVTDTPETADTIWRRYADYPKWKSLAHTPRRERAMAGRLLQEMAEAGEIERHISEERGFPIPMFQAATDGRQSASLTRSEATARPTSR